ncbi:hypothetical protein FA13DRAFT_1740703 [Coprinellus micaceus]|uniref:Uncharacterized protein n=1 Tax=Coprinellus micaceus TaxID=71717 RepID=A0A4Y7SNF7_COPMI|nr:hypothetical protein FA13DRAFT_1740703 [Coprinellus micaceus]
MSSLVACSLLEYTLLTPFERIETREGPTITKFARYQSDLSAQRWAISTQRCDVKAPSFVSHFPSSYHLRSAVMLTSLAMYTANDTQAPRDARGRSVSTPNSWLVFITRPWVASTKPFSFV